MNIFLNFFKEGNFKKDFIYLAKLLVIFFGYYITAKLGLTLDAVSGFATLVWPPTGIALAAIFIFGFEVWPAIFIGAFFVNSITGASIPVASGIAFGNTLEAVIGVYLLNKFRFSGTQKTLKDVFIFVVFGTLINTALAATIGVSSLLFGGVVTFQTFIATWVAWWIGDALGALIIGNLIIIFFVYRNKISFKNIKILKIFELMILFISLIIFNLAVFVNFFVNVVEKPNDFVLTYLIFIFLIWSSIRFSQIASSLVVFITSTIAIWGAVIGTGPFVADMLSNRLLMLQSYIAIISITSMVLASLIAERFSAEEDLLNEKNKDEAILESVGEGVIVIDTDGTILLTNHAAQKMLHMDSNMIGENYEKAVPVSTIKGVPVPSIDRPFRKSLLTNKVITDTLYITRQDGNKFPVALTTAPIIFQGKVVGVIDVFRDITHEMDVDRAKSEFVSLASHQLRTPLTTMKWYSHELLGENMGTLSKKQKEYIKEVYHNNQRMIELVNALLNVSRIELGTFLIKPIPLKVGKIIDEIVHDMSQFAKSKGISIKKEYDKDAPLLNIDPDLIRIVFQNLLTNSIKYSKENSVVHISAKKEGGEILFTVSDKGYGIAEEQKDKIFTKLFRTDVARTIDPEGNGLGLYVVKSVVEQSGGRVWFKSEVNKGSTFYVAFPLSGMAYRESKSTLIYS